MGGGGFACSRCGNVGEPYRFPKPHVAVDVVLGRVPRDDADVGTVWPPIPAPLGISRYETTFQRLHKLRAAMVRPERDAIGGQYPVEVDETLVAGRDAGSLTAFVNENVPKASVVRKNGWRGYDGLPTMGYSHEPVVLDGDPEMADAHLPMIHLMFSNLKTWLFGTHHGVGQQHL